MAYEQRQLPNDVQLHMINTDDLVVEHINLHFILPMADMPYASTVLPKILLNGCKKYPTKHDISKRLAYLFNASIWASTAYYGEYVGVTFSASFLKNSAAYDGCDIMGSVLDLMYDVIFDPVTENGVFCEKYTQTEIKNQCDAMRAAINNKDNYAYLRCMQLMCQGQTIEFTCNTDTCNYENMTAQNVFDYYTDMLQTAPVIMVYAGDRCDIAEKFAQRVSNALGQRTVRPYSNLTPYIIPNEVRYVEEKQDVKQAHLVIGLRDKIHASDKKLYATAVFEELFGQSPVSRLFCNVREKHSLCYYCTSGHDEANGQMYISTGIKAENKDKALKEILYQLEEIKKGNISKEELEIAKKSVKSGWLARKDSAGALASRCIYRVFFCGEYTSVEDEVQLVQSVTVKDIQEIACGLQTDTVYFMYGDEANGGENDGF